MSENTFMKLYREATLPQNGTLYSGAPEASEAEVMEAFMAYAEASANMERNGMLYAEATQELMESKGLSMVGAIMYGEAEGGFFKKIIAAIVKLYEKAKDFVIKLLGRFKSNKNYRNDFIYIQQVFAKVAKLDTFNSDASFKYKDCKYAAISNLIQGTIGGKGKDRSMLNLGFGGDENTVSSLTRQFNDVSKVKGVDTTKVNALATALEKTRSSDDTRDSDSILRFIYRKAIGDADTGAAKFGNRDNMSPSEAVNKLWEGQEITKKGAEIKSFVVELAKSLNQDLEFDSIERALDKGVSAYKEKVDELKRIMNQVSETASNVDSDRDNKNQNDRDNAGKLMRMNTDYSKFMTDLSTAVVTAFNTGKIQLDKFIAALKAMADTLDKFKELETESAK